MKKALLLFLTLGVILAGGAVTILLLGAAALSAPPEGEKTAGNAALTHAGKGFQASKMLKSRWKDC